MAMLPVSRKNQGQMATRRDFPMERGRGLDMLFDRLFSNWLAPFEPEMGTMRLWDFDVTDNDQEISIRAEMPGFEEKEIDVQLHNDVLTIKAEKEQRGDQAEEYRSFQRVVTLPSGIDADRVQANYRNGVLDLHLPKTEGAQPRRIKVQGGQGEIASEQSGGQQTAAGSTAAGSTGQHAASSSAREPSKGGHEQQSGTSGKSKK